MGEWRYQPFNYIIVRTLKIERFGCHSSHNESRFPTRLVETSCLLTGIRLEFLTDSLKNSDAVCKIPTGKDGVQQIDMGK